MKETDTQVIGLMTAHEVAKKLNLSRAYVYQLIQEKMIPSVKIGGTTVRVRPEDLDHFILSNLTIKQPNL